MQTLLNDHSIIANENILACVTDNKEIISAGTKLEYIGSQLSWDYYRAPNGLTVILMGWQDEQRQKVSVVY